jgi:hypothetical protein
MSRPFVFFILLSVLLPPVALADSASSTSFFIESGVIDVGGGQATSAGFNVRSSLGQPGTGVSTSTSFILRGGFLNFPVVVSSAAPPPVIPPGPAPTPAPTGGGGTGFLFPTKKIIPPLPGACSPDLNKDGRVDIADLSILLYYYGKSGPEVAGCFDFSGNGVVGLADISIMMFYWTG